MSSVDDEIARRFALGQDDETIATWVAMSRNAVKKRRAKLSLARRLAYRPHAPGLDAELARLVEGGLMATEVALELGYTVRSVQQLAHDRGLAFAPAWRGGPERRGQRQIAEQWVGLRREGGRWIAEGDDCVGVGESRMAALDHWRSGRERVAPR